MNIPQFSPAEFFAYSFIFLLAGIVIVAALAFVITYSVGAANMALKATPGILKKVTKYFATPSDRGFELNWFLRQFFRLFSERMSERWYEARQHTYRGVWVSLMCAFGICEVVRYEYTSRTDDSRMYTKTVVYWWKFIFEKKSRLHRFLFTQWSVIRPHMAIDADSPYQIFRAGHNVIWDFMSGSFEHEELTVTG